MTFRQSGSGPAPQPLTGQVLVTGAGSGTATDVNITEVNGVAVTSLPASNETSTIYDGTTPLTPKFAVISASSSGASQLVALVAAKRIRIINIILMSNAAVNVKFQSHAAGDITGLLYLAANTGFAPGYDPTGHFQTTAGEALDINLSGNVAVGGWLKYLEV